MVKAAPEPGTLLLGKYRVERRLGVGGMGVVVEATHVDLHQRVAIKLLNADLAENPENVARFLREARIAATLPSEHIARVSDIGQTESGAPYLVMELLVGQDLEVELSRRKQLPVIEAVDIILQASMGVADAHAAGLVHRDLKPANLFLTQRPHRKPIVKVLDFGLSKDASGDRGHALTAVDRVFGTPQYMSPEQVISSKNVDARSDQHALGAILFELLTGRPPYVAQNVMQLLTDVMKQPPPHARALRRDVPAGLDTVIVRALAKKPRARFADLAAFAEALIPFGGPQAVQQAAAIRGALSAARRPASSRETILARASSRANDIKQAGLAAAKRAMVHSHPGVTSSVDPILRTHHGKRMLLAAGVGALMPTMLIVAVLGRGSVLDVGRRANAEGSPSAAAAASPPALVEATGRRAAPAPAVAPHPKASASAAAPASSAPAASTDPSKTKPPATGAGLSPHPAVSSAPLRRP